MDDVTFGRNGRDAGNGWQHSASVINYVRDRDVYECLLYFASIVVKTIVKELHNPHETGGVVELLVYRISTYKAMLKRGIYVCGVCGVQFTKL